MPALYVMFYVYIAFAVVYFSLKLSTYVDLLDKKTNVSGAFLGGVLLAAITSLPELFTSLTATIGVHNNHLVIGNILGSDLFNLCLFIFVFIIFFKNMVKAKVNKAHIITILLCFVMYILTTLGGFVFDNLKIGWFNPISIAIAIVYVIAIIKTPKEEESEEKEDNCNLTVKQIIFRFILFSLLLVASSILMTYLVDKIVEVFNIGATFGGALFLGVATSLPELTSTYNLCKKRNYNAAIGDLLGSNVFNFLILTIGDIFSFMCKENGTYIGIYSIDQSSFLLLIFGVIALALIAILVISKIKNKVKDNIKSRLVYFGLSSLVVIIYFVFLILSNIDLNIPFASF